MAADKYLMEHAQEPVLRYYGWKPAALSLGKSQRQLADIQLKACQARGIELVRRPSGGKTVLHSDELTYSIIFKNIFLKGGILECYRLISSAIVAGLKKPELKLAPHKRSKTKGTNCFIELSPFEVAYKGKKLIGSAQTRTRKAVLQHGSILLDIDYDLWRMVWPNIKNSSTKEFRMTSLKGLGYDYSSIQQLSDLISPKIAELFSLEIEILPFSPAEIKKISQAEAEFKLAYQDFLNA